MSKERVEKCGYTMRVCIGEDRVRVACSMLYPIFKFGCCLGGNTT